MGLCWRNQCKPIIRFMEFIIPPFDRKQNPAGIYKITFNDNWFYIGSSKKLRSRFRTWKVVLTKRQFLKNINIKQILDGVALVKFEIIRVYADEKLIRKAETALLKKNWENPLLLNRCPDGSTNTGMRPYNGQVRVKDKPRLPVGFNRKKIAQFDLQGNLIKIHDSIKAASVYSGVKDDLIRKVFNGRAVSPRKFIFKGVNEDGSFIEPKYASKVSPETVAFIIENYAKYGRNELCRILSLSPNYVSNIAFGRERKGIVTEGLPKPKKLAAPKPVLKFDIDGNYLGRYDSIGQAAKSIGVKSTSVQNVLNYGRRQTHGYVFKYAD